MYRKYAKLSGWIEIVVYMTRICLYVIYYLNRILVIISRTLVKNSEKIETYTSSLKDRERKMYPGMLSATSGLFQL